jgi:hypothetical protein
MRSDGGVLDASAWCDKWCERCPLADSCPVGRVELRRPSASPAENLAQAIASLARAEALLEAELLREGLEVREEDVAAWVAEDEALFSHPLALQASCWSAAARGWLAGASGEAAAVVGWYGSLIPAKVHRALGAIGSHEPDALGTAKVVTLGLHRVIEAVSDWCGQHPLDRGATQLVVASADLVVSVEATFPGHLSFRRPGLDP